MAFPTGGNLADTIVEQILKAATVTGQSVSRDIRHVTVAPGDAAAVERADARGRGAEHPLVTSEKP
jgi:hypothetical protein